MNLKVTLLLFSLCVVYAQNEDVLNEVRNSTHFSLDFYRSTFDANKNMVTSPISFRIILSLLYHSTFGDTEKELQNFIHFDTKAKTAVSQRLTLEQLMKNPSLKVVNRIYVKEGEELNDALTEVATKYHSAIEQKDFTKSVQTANELNQFVEEQTNHLIKDLFSADSFDYNTRLVLLNTLYFKADWENEFVEDFEVLPFYGIDWYNRYRRDRRVHLIDFMVDTNTFDYHDSSTLQATTLVLPYASESNTKFWIILPHENSDINELKNKLTYAALNTINSDLNSTYSKISIPKFEIETEIDGVAAFRKFGLNSMFDKSEIVALKSNEYLYVSDAKQKVKIIVNRQGTEAAAASYAALTYHSLGGFIEPEYKFIANRPFIYLILTADTNEPLFIGHFSNPNQNV